MNIETGHLLKIMYCPSMYCHASYLMGEQHEQVLFNGVLLNYWLISYYQLEDLPGSWSPDCITASLIINNWQQLNRLAHLIGGYLLRSQLLRRGEILATDKKLQSFISLPLAHHVVIKYQPGLSTMSCGAAYILALAEEIPFALHQRIKMNFSRDEKLPDIDVLPIPEHINLLKMGIAYAKN